MESIDENGMIEVWLSTYSERTRKAYSKNILSYFNYCAKLSLNPKEISHTHLEVYKEELLKKHSTATVAQIVSTISSYYDFLEGKGLIKNNPVNLVNKDDLKVEPYTNTIPIDPMGMKAILDSIDQDTPSGSRDSAILSLIFFHGIKASSALKIRMKDFIEKPEGEYLIVPRKEGSREEILLESYVVEKIEYCLSFDLRDEIGENDLVFLPTRETGTHLSLSHDRSEKTAGLTMRALEDNFRRYAKIAGCEGATLNSVYQASAYYQHCMGMEEEQVKYYMDHSTKGSIRRFLKQRAKTDALANAKSDEDE